MSRDLKNPKIIGGIREKPGWRGDRGEDRAKPGNATLIEAPKSRPRKLDDGLSHTKDPVAMDTKKHGRTYHGYRAHIATDRRGVITDYVFDTAKAHDAQHIDQLIEGETKWSTRTVLIMDQARKTRLEGEGVFCGAIDRRVRGQEQMTDEQAKHNRVCAAIRAIVEHPFRGLRGCGGWGTRWCGTGD